MHTIFKVLVSLILLFSISNEVFAERPSPSEGRTGLLIFGILVVVMMGVAVALSLIRKEGMEEDEDEDEEEDTNESEQEDKQSNR